MTLVEYITIALALAGSVGGVGSFLWRHIEKIRGNDLKHVDERLDRIEEKLDNHLQWHLDKD